jgi:3-hydroxyisobutyrate dehydrogenase
MNLMSLFFNVFFWRSQSFILSTYWQQILEIAAVVQDLDIAAFGQVVGACPMASAYSHIKVGKMLNQDWSLQAALKDCYNSTQLIQSAAVSENTGSPLMDVCGKLYAQAMEAGLGEEDMIAIPKQIGDREK